MSSRYDFEITVNLKENAPDEVIRMVAFLMTAGEERPLEIPDDPFFGDDLEQDRFSNWATGCDPHAGDAVCSFRRVYRFSRGGIDHYNYTLHLRFCAKLETIAEGLLFAMWLAKWSDQNECVGYYKCEVSRHPTLLYFHNSELYLGEVVEPPRRATDGAFWK